MNIKTLEVAVPNASTLSPEEFALCRKNGLGASDSSVVLGTMDKFRTPDMLFEEKIRKYQTPEEQEIGEKVNVRKGKDLEPLIITKAEAVIGFPLFKPTDMYRIKEYPYLTVNFDGVYYVDDVAVPYPIPVECKYISTYGAKYYDFSKAAEEQPLCTEPDVDILASHYGIPSYYYVQLQHQLLGLNAPYGYLAALNDKDWTLYLFKIPANKHTQNRIITEGYKFWQRVTNFL